MRRWALPALGVVSTLLLAAEAAARVGGGQDYSRSPSGGGGYGGGGGGGDDLTFGLVYLLVRLVIEVPIIGVPLVFIVVGVVVARAVFATPPTARRTHRTHPASRLASPRAPQQLAALRANDPAFSTTVLLDFVVLVARRALEAVATRGWEALTPFVSDGAQKRLTEIHAGVTLIREVVPGGVRLLAVERRGEAFHIAVRIEMTRVEVKGDRAERFHADEVWAFRRPAGVVSPAPEVVERLGCPSCGAAVEVTPLGACRSCGTPITSGQLSWQLVAVEVRDRHPATVQRVTRSSGGEEGSYRVKLPADPDLNTALAALKQRHGAFDEAAFAQRTALVFERLQSAWSDGRWSEARPFVTDRMFQTLRFYVEGYERAGLRNHLDDIHLERQQIVRVEVDRYFEAITVRLWGSMKDSVIDGTGRVVGGNADVARRFSELWTFLRSAEGAGDSHGDRLACPSCGAPLDRVNETGICGYCDSKITTGRFDWVLARIEQPESWTS